MMSDPARLSAPVMVYDGQCPFCRRWVSRWQAMTRGRIVYLPYQAAASQFPQIPRTDFERAVQLIEPDGRVSSAALAVFRSLALAGRWKWLLRAYYGVPGFARAAESVYRWVARNRGRIQNLAPR